MIVTQNEQKVRLAAAIERARSWRLESLPCVSALGVSLLANLHREPPRAFREFALNFQDGQPQP